ncbi:MAG TPA: DUF4140 domain-containing protein [Geobacteraceae bacterium]|nr:DUF4140 domain-containing protein [Geobacteraceae bacterium]
MRTLILALFVLAVASQSMAGEKTVTYFLDGAKVTCETAFDGGYAEVRLPGGLVADSIRIMPQSGVSIDKLELNIIPKGTKTKKEIVSLEERKNLLQDRLKALETREEIFTAAAKSQSGRSPRKTKNDPEPMANIRKGTEFAISQLESVYAMRRKSEQELASLENRLSALRGTNGAEESVCRIWFSGKKGRARISYLVSNLSWQPVYDFRLNGNGRAAIIMRAVFSYFGKNTSAFIVQSKMFDVDGNTAVAKSISKPYGKIAEFSFPVEKETVLPGPVDSLKFTVNNDTDRHLPAGYAYCYLHGEYLGGFSFKGAGPRESVTLSIGKTAGQ